MDIKLWNKNIPEYQPNFHQPEPFMTAYFASGSTPLPAILICPGGGYVGLAEHEGRGIARHYVEKGFHCFVLSYRLTPYKAPLPLLDAQRALKLLHYHAREYNIDAAKIFVMGFSAGGHLAATLLTMKNIKRTRDKIDQQPLDLAGGILCYPVISMREDITHAGSVRSLLGYKPTFYARRKWSADENVTEKTPPCFIWHTADDGSVSVANSLRMAGALSDHNVPVELHVFPHGRHGLGLLDEEPDVVRWGDWARQWMDKRCDEIDKGKNHVF